MGFFTKRLVRAFELLTLHCESPREEQSRICPTLTWPGAFAWGGQEKATFSSISLVSAQHPLPLHRPLPSQTVQPAPLALQASVVVDFNKGKSSPELIAPFISQLLSVPSVRFCMKSLQSKRVSYSTQISERILLREAWVDGYCRPLTEAVMICLKIIT